MRMTSWTVHSIQARQPSRSGASIARGLNTSRPEASILFVLRPVWLPKNAVCFSSAGPGTVIAKASLKRIMSAVWGCGWMTQPTNGGSIEGGASQAMGAAFVIPRHEVVTMATGPGFRIRRASVTSQRRRMDHVRVHEEAGPGPGRGHAGGGVVGGPSL